MPLGVQRINAPQSAHPTPHIAFIKPLPGPGEAQSQAFLSRVAAIVHPILAAHSLAVMTLEEHEPNSEFLGRNFNAGEVIQLVLRRRHPHAARRSAAAAASEAIPRHAVQSLATVAARTGPGSEAAPLWLPFRSVVLVMLHELAHCVQMNHSRAFWKVRNDYAAEMRELWAQGYRGEGMWGRGRAVEDGALGFGGATTGLEDDMPAHLCGGVYRRRRRGKKRKRAVAGDGEQLTYAERQQRRIRKKFGEGGTALGDDAAVRAELEKKAGAGKKKKVASASKPRVAQSNRGRELRAQAALARLGQLGQNGTESGIKSEERQTQTQTQLPFTKGAPPPTIPIKQEDISTDDETDSGSESGSAYSIPTTMDPLELVKICPESGSIENQDEAEAEHVKAERRELDDIYRIPLAAPSPSSSPRTPPETAEAPTHLAQPEKRQRQQTTQPVNGANTADAAAATTTVTQMEMISCPACSLENSPLQAICGACGCVVRPEKAPGHWRCGRASCADGPYVNSGDYGVCGICGARRADAEEEVSNTQSTKTR